MRGVLVKEWTEFDRLSVVPDIPLGEPGEREIRIDVHAAGVSFAASLVVSGRYQRKPPLPFVPGTECAGVIDAVGPRVEGLAVGDRVVASVDWGAMAQSVVTPYATTFRIPAGLPFAQAVPLTNSYMTSLAALTWPHLLDVRAGQTLLVHGAAGGVGLAAVELGKILGARVIAVAGGPEKVAAVLEHGADHAIDHRTQDFRTSVLELTGGRGVDAVLDPVGGDVFDTSLRCIAAQGRIAPIGFAGGRIPQIPANLLLVKNITVCGLNLGYHYGWSPTDMRWHYREQLAGMMARLGAWWEAGRIRPTVSHEFPLEGFREAMQVVLGRRSIGRVVLAVKPSG